MSVVHNPYSSSEMEVPGAVLDAQPSAVEQMLMDVAIGCLQNAKFNPGNKGVRIADLEAAMAGHRERVLIGPDADNAGCYWSRRRIMDAVLGDKKTEGLKRLLAAHANYFVVVPTLKAEDLVLLQPLLDLAPAASPEELNLNWAEEMEKDDEDSNDCSFPQPGNSGDQCVGKAYKAKVKDVVGELPSLSWEDARKKVVAAVELLLNDADCNPGKGSVPVARVWSALVQRRQDQEVMWKLLRLNLKTFVDFLDSVQDLFSIENRTRLVPHVRLVNSIGWQAANVQNKRKAGDEREHLKRSLEEYLLQCPRQCCTVKEFLEAYQHLPCNAAGGCNTPRAGDFVRLVKASKDKFSYDAKSNEISFQPPVAVPQP
eukprot:EG_transcript_10075